ncbi:hypothetical protein AB0D74_19260 [Streptomyces sp. NPDC048278]|uniref:hypothetical protein n=1 Tax=Streptomyces sp. NPDC048278 TaxID=3155809 RepID=UPI0034491670
MVVRRHRASVVLGVVLMVVPAMIGLTACESDDAVNCVRAADALSESVGILGEALKDSVLYPESADKSIARVRGNLQDLRAKHHDKDVVAGVDDMEKALDNVQKSVHDGDKTPDLTPVVNGTARIARACAR